MIFIILVTYRGSSNLELADLATETDHLSGGSRIFERWFPLVVDHRHKGLGAQPPTAEEFLIFKRIQSIESYKILYLRPLYQL